MDSCFTLMKRTITLFAAAFNGRLEVIKVAKVCKGAENERRKDKNGPNTCIACDALTLALAWSRASTFLCEGRLCALFLASRNAAFDAWRQRAQSLLFSSFCYKWEMCALEVRVFLEQKVATDKNGQLAPTTPISSPLKRVHSTCLKTKMVCVHTFALLHPP